MDQTFSSTTNDADTPFNPMTSNRGMGRGNGITTPWQDWEIEMLKTMITAGAAPSQIAHKINANKRTDLRSRNSVIGKAHRLGLNFGFLERKKTRVDNEVIIRKKKSKRKINPTEQRYDKHFLKQPSFKKEKHKVVVPDIPKPASCNNVYLPKWPGRHRCRHITGDPMRTGAFWCGAPCRGSWCTYHEKMVYTEPQPRKRKDRERLHSYR